jgi:ribosomal protein S18 acetylase RimI-like enzyme
MRSDSYSIRVMSRREVDIAVDWAAAEGWNPGLNDADCFYAADEDGFLVGLLDDEPIATISAVRYGATFGFIGFYIVLPEYRRQGYAIQIWNAALERLEGRVIGLDGVVDQQDNYRKSGFELAYRNIRYQGSGGGEPPDADIVALDTLAFANVHAYDCEFFPADRKLFLRTWIDQPNATSVGILAGGQLAGYGVMRPCRTGHKIGPLFADSPELAGQLFDFFRSRAGAGSPIFLDIPEVNRAAVELVGRHGMSRVFETARMYAGGIPELPVDRLFGVTTFELG